MKKLCTSCLLAAVLGAGTSGMPQRSLHNDFYPTAIIATTDTTWETIIDGSSFANYASLESKWNYFYPWGINHNGSARMFADTSGTSNISLLQGNVLHIRADYITTEEGKSDKNPFLEIKYRSGAIHAKHQVKVSDEYPMYEVSGSFKAPIVKGSWPAFWITGSKSWPPEADILEYKGDDTNWLNTFITPSQITTTKVKIPDAHINWHHYKAVLKKLNATDVSISYYIDHKLSAVHTGNFMNKPLWIIINLQMEGSSGRPGPTTVTDYYIKNILVRRGR